MPGPSEIPQMINWLETRGPLVIGGVGHPWSLGGRHALTITGVDRSKGVFYLSNTGVSFQHAVSFAEVSANMPFVIAYISPPRSSFNLPSTDLSPCGEESAVFTGGGCPEISCAIHIKINEIVAYMEKLRTEAYSMLFLKDIKKEDLYHLYKTLMLKSLGERHVLSYPSLLLERSYYNGNRDIVIETDNDYTKIHRHYGDPSDPYIWDWQPWIENILYQAEADCHITVANDPVTFYLRKPMSDEIIKDALARMAHLRKQKDIQYTSTQLPLLQELPSEEFLFTLYKNMDAFISIPFLGDVFAQTPNEKIGHYLQEKNIDPTKISQEDFNKIMENLGLDEENISISNIADSYFSSPGDQLTCGMEIPVGETFQIIWDHFIELLFTMDTYIMEAMKLYELQQEMNYLASFCSCPCVGPCCDCDPPYPGTCVLTCDRALIEALYFQKIIPQRIRLEEIAQYIKHLTEGYFNTPTENICHPLNEEIRDYSEKEFCSRGGRRFITKHELIARKLNYSRYAFDECTTRTEHFEDVLEKTRAGKTLIFGPIAEEKDLPRYTKTKIGGFVVNTHKFNWFCCSDEQLQR
jgi:hypothetical protein